MPFSGGSFFDADGGSIFNAALHTGPSGIVIAQSTPNSWKINLSTSIHTLAGANISISWFDLTTKLYNRLTKTSDVAFFYESDLKSAPATFGPFSLGDSYFVGKDSNGDHVYASAHENVPVPEPTTLALLTLGIAGIGYSRKK